MTRVNIELPEELHKQIKIISATEGVSLKQFINKIIEDKLKHEKIK